MVGKRAAAVRQIRTLIPEVATRRRATAQHDHTPARERVLDLDPVRVPRRAGAADAQVAAAVDDEARVSGEQLGRHVGGESLAGAAAVEAHAGRALDVPARSSTRIVRHRFAGLGPAGRRGGAAAIASSTEAGSTPSRELP